MRPFASGGRLAYPSAVASVPFARAVVTLVLLGSIGASFLGSRCDLPQAGQAQAAVSAVGADGDADPCGSGCKPDCFVCSCARSEAAAYAQLEYQPPVVVATVPGPDARPSDGVLTLPDHPPHRLL